MKKETHEGYIFVFNEESRNPSLIANIRVEGRFTDTISQKDLKPGNFEICFVSFDAKSINYVCLFRLGKAVVTAKSRILFSNFFEFSPIKFEDIEKDDGVNYLQFATISSSGLGSRVPSSLWEKLIAAITARNPDAHQKYMKLVETKLILTSAIQAKGVDIMAQEKDATGLALDIFGLDREEILFSWAPTSTSEAAPYVTGFSDPRILEDPMVIRDTQVFKDWKSTPPDMIGTVQFRKENEVLSITNFNRHKVENNAGVDLVYYNHTYNSYVMIQYKRMETESERMDNGRVRRITLFRPIGDSYLNEIRQMKALEECLSFKAETATEVINDYRLHGSPFYFKLCLPFHLELSSSELIKGMYFPLDYWEKLLATDQVKGKLGGVRVVYQDSKRHLNNTLFVDLVHYGWIGSKLHQVEIITELIRQSIEKNNSLILAISNELKQ